MHPDAVAGNNGEAPSGSGAASCWCRPTAPAPGTARRHPGPGRQPELPPPGLHADVGRTTVHPDHRAGQRGRPSFSYLNKKLTKDQIEECLPIANYLAAPYGSDEYTARQLRRPEGVDYTTGDGRQPASSTTQGTKEAATTTFQFLAVAAGPWSRSPGLRPDITKESREWQADAVKYALQAAVLRHERHRAVPPGQRRPPASPVERHHQPTSVRPQADRGLHRPRPRTGSTGGQDLLDLYQRKSSTSTAPVSDRLREPAGGRRARGGTRAARSARSAGRGPGWRAAAARPDTAHHDRAGARCCSPSATRRCSAW